MKKTITTSIVVFAFLSFVAWGVDAYTPPTTAPTQANTNGPIVIDGTNQVKLGGLSVGAFYTTGNAQLAQTAAFAGTLYGGTSTTPAALAFGTPTNQVNIEVSGATYATDSYKTAFLASTDSFMSKLCAEQTGALSICPFSIILPPSERNKVTLEYVYNDIVYCKQKTTSGDTSSSGQQPDCSPDPASGGDASRSGDGGIAGFTIQNLDTGLTYSVTTTKTTNPHGSNDDYEVGRVTVIPGVYEITAIQTNCGTGYTATAKEGRQFIIDETFQTASFGISCSTSDLKFN